MSPQSLNRQSQVLDHPVGLSRRSFLKFGGIMTLALSGASLGLMTSCSSRPSEEDEVIFSGALISKAHSVLSDVVRYTPLVPFAMNGYDGPEIYLKLENLQLTGSFKIRGAAFRMSQLSPDERVRGVATCSAGNHAQGVALTAQKMSIPATIFIPSEAPLQKIERTRRYGVDVRLVDHTFDDAKKACEQFVAETGAVYVPPYDDPHIMAGQATIGHEIIETLSKATAIVVPVGGGGLIGGVSYAAKSLNPKIKVYGVESYGAPSMTESLAAGEIVTVKTDASLADGLDVATPGKLPFKIAQENVDGMFLVSEELIAQGIGLLAREAKVVTEGAGAIAFAAVYSGVIPLTKDDRVVCLVSGGNIDAQVLSNEL